MDVVFYYKKQEKFCPALRYFTKKIEKSELKKERKESILTDIDNKIMHAKSVNGRPDGGILKPIKGYSLIEIKSEKNESTQIRILYATYQDKLILLDAFEKPRNYKLKGQRKVEERYDIAERYYKDFKNNPKSYKKYE